MIQVAKEKYFMLSDKGVRTSVRHAKRMINKHKDIRQGMVAIAKFCGTPVSKFGTLSFEEVIDVVFNEYTKQYITTKKFQVDDICHEHGVSLRSFFFM